MNTLIVGAGRMGRAAGFYLKSQGVDVIYADKSWDALDIASEGCTTAVIPIVENTKWEQELEGIDVVLSAADYSINVDLSIACLNTNTHMCDLGGNNDIVQAQLSLNKEINKDINCTIIPDCGLAPGLAGWLAAYAVQELDENSSFMGLVDKVEIRVGGLPSKLNPPLNYAIYWSTKGLINEYIEPTIILKDSKIKTVDSLDGLEKIHFDGYPEMEAFYTSGGLSTLPQSLLGKVRNLDYKTIRYAGHCKIIQALKQIGYFSEIPDGAVTPRLLTENLLQKNLRAEEPDVVFLRASAIMGNEKIKYTIIDHENLDTGHTAMARLTGYSAGIVAYMLGNGDIAKKGVVTGENAVPMNKFIDKLENTGIKINKSCT